MCVCLLFIGELRRGDDKTMALLDDDADADDDDDDNDNGDVFVTIIN